MKNFNIHTRIESNNEYFFDGDCLSVELCDTIRLNEKIYRAIYMSDKTYLDTAIYLKDISDVTLDFGGATLLLRDDTIQPFVLDRCNNVTIKNVVIEYERSLMDEIDIVDVRDGEIWCKQTDKQKRHFPLKVENGSLIPVAPGKEYPDALKPPMFFNLYDKDTHLCKRMYLVRIGRDLPHIPKEQFPFHYSVLIAEQRGEYIVLSGDVPSNIISGVTAAISHSSRDLSSCFIIRSKNTRLENFRILNGGGMGILGMYSENITLDSVKYFCDERSHGIATNAADAVHLISCFGKVEIVNSVFESMKDDALNIHGNYYTIQSVDQNVIHTKINTDVQANPGINAHYKMFGDGDTIAVYNGSTTLSKQILTIEKIEVTGYFTADLYVSGDTSSLIAGDTVENLSAQADLHIKNCRFGKAETHLRLQTRGKTLMEDCECSLKILLTGDKNYWFEGSPVNDLTIKNCRFVGDRACINSIPEFVQCPESPYYHSGIRVIGNSFDSATALDLFACCDVLFEKNTNTLGIPFENKYRDCDRITEK